MTGQPNVGAQPTFDHRRPAQWAFGAAVVLWAVGVLADKVGCTAQGYAGVVLGGAAMGVSIAQAAAHDWAICRTRWAAHTQPTSWAPMGADEAGATLLQLVSSRPTGGGR